MFIKKILLISTVIFIFSSHFASARRIKYWSDINSAVLVLGYNRQEAGKITSDLAGYFPELARLKSETDPLKKVSGLAEIIRSRIYKTNDLLSCELPWVLEKARANCLGYAQVFYVLGKALGLDVDFVSEYPGHIANLVKIGTQHVIVDITWKNVFSPYYISGMLDLQKSYESVTDTLMVARDPNGILGSYRIIEKIGAESISAARLTNAGIAQLEAGNYAEAKKYFQQATSSDFSYASAHNMLGVAIAESQQDYKKAIEEFDIAIGINKFYALAYSNKGNALSELRQYNQAIENFRKAVSIDSNCALAWAGLGIALYLHTEKKEEGISAIERGLFINRSLYFELPGEIQNLPAIAKFYTNSAG